MICFRKTFWLVFLGAVFCLMVSPVAGQEKGRVPFILHDHEIPGGPLGDAVELGENIVLNTQHFAKDYVGNGLNCRNCHLSGGITPNAMPYVGLPGLFPMYRPRSGKVISLQERINGCFKRSLNGRPLPLDSPEMTALVAYMTWLSWDVPLGREVEGRGTKRLAPPERAPDPERGKTLFGEHCTHCHGEDGQGIRNPDGSFLFPPLWGDQSFNIAAGMARLNTAAAFIKHNMPFGQGDSLSDQDAYDIALYVTTQPRPDYPEKARDWPFGGKPPDARY